MRIPLLDLHCQNDPLKERIDIVLEKLFEHQKFILGPEVGELEKKIAEYCNSVYAIGVASGSDALFLSLLACGIRAGDEVITTPFTFFATAGAIERVGAIPVFVDIDPRTFNINHDEIERSISESTKAIIPVHLFGLMCDMDPIMMVAQKYNLFVIEDAAQSIGSLYKGKKACSIGDLGCVSFFPSKNLGCFGDGGMVVANNKELADKVRILRTHGAVDRYFHKEVGINSRLDTLQAAILGVKLDFLEKWHETRIENANYYNASIKNPMITTPFLPEGYRHIYNQYTLRVKNREKLVNILNKEGIGNCIYYPLSLHLQPCFHELEYQEGDFPISEQASKECLSIPVFPGLTIEQKNYIIDILNNFS
ncbi:MAG: DegT/DnrJ/EryC1/StrS family aminotransferase [Candidatus Coatesbacteria bacterium]|nr:DegT/DnrJ/EryC1/StrS family aminotransferase [Candidatus Coatesbacteria bacterium]